MTVQEVLDQLDELDGDEREHVLRPLVAQFSPPSLATLRVQMSTARAQDMSWEAFRVDQSRVIRECVALEVAQIGRDVRTALGLKPLTLEMELSDGQ